MEGRGGRGRRVRGCGTIASCAGRMLSKGCKEGMRREMGREMQSSVSGQTLCKLGLHRGTAMRGSVEAGWKYMHIAGCEVQEISRVVYARKKRNNLV